MNLVKRSIGHCHITSDGHNEAMELRRKQKQRQPALATMLENITPTVLIQVRIFRHDITKLFLCLRVSMSSVGKQIVKDFVHNHIGPNMLSDRANLSRDYIPAIDMSESKQHLKF